MGSLSKMQASKWSRENLEMLVQDLLEENKRLTRINWGRIIAIVFFLAWAIVTWSYFSPVKNSPSCKCAAKGCSVSKLQTPAE